MAENPIKLKEMKKTINSTREALFAEEASKIIGTKGFIFNKHKSDKEKSNEYAIKRRESELLNRNESQAFNTIMHEINQPSMRFKPRTDMERICEIFQNYKKDKRSRDKKTNDKSEANIPQFISNEAALFQPNAGIIANNDDYIISFKQKTSHQDTIIKSHSNKSHSYQPKIKRIDNSEAKKIYPELYIKTYFKATENFSLMKKSCVLDHNTLQSKTTKKNIHPKRNYYNSRNSHHQNAKTQGASLNNNSSFCQIRQLDKCPIHSKSSQKQLMSILNACNNQYSTTKDKEMQLLKSLESVDMFTQCMSKAKEKREKVDKEKMALLEELAFHRNETIKSKNKPHVTNNQKHPRDGIYYDNDENNFQQLENKITIEGEIYDKNDLNNISKKILSTCNWIHHKSKEATTSHIDRNGKLVCKGGLTIAQFEKKYKLFPIVNKNN